MIRIAALYTRTDKRGRKYLVGRFGSAQVFIFSNPHRSSGRHPNAELYIAATEAGGGDLTPAELLEFKRLLSRDEPAASSATAESAGDE